MESKLPTSADNTGSDDHPFNRTSMESKHVWHAGCLTLGRLLIEPVWNRNEIASACEAKNPSLLIEPVWNRNLYVCARPLKTNRKLLIEPVWNRNLYHADGFLALVYAFNRTSMESKRSWWERYFVLSERASLLIEPVWNQGKPVNHINPGSDLSF